MYEYESPINRICGEICNEIIRKDEEHLMTFITQEVGYQVDKSELIKALNYDRNQYSKGYKDGVKDVLDKIRTEITKLQTYKMFYGEDTVYVERDDVLEILDKYKESEDNE